MRSIPGEFIAIITKLESELAESQAREAQLRAALEPMLIYLNMLKIGTEPGKIGKLDPLGAVLEDIDRVNNALSLPAPDLIGVIKDLSVALSLISTPSYTNGVNTRCTEGCDELASRALAYTREIRERIGAT